MACDQPSSEQRDLDFDDHDFRESFIPVPDVGGGTTFPCNLMRQDCPPGDKCMPWSEDFTDTWNATRCSPVASDPAGVGMPCTIEGPVTSGIDDCARGTMCLDLVSSTNEGTCVPMFTGSHDHPICLDRMRHPIVGASVVLPLCLPSCRPLEHECPAGYGCYPSGDALACSPDASAGQGNAGDPCEFANGCSDGLVCIGGTNLPECEGSSCCTPYCDTNRPSCPDGLTCQPWPDDASLLPGGESLGICVG